MIQMKGIVTLKLTDTVTGKVTEMEQENIITNNEYVRMVSGYQLGPYIVISGATAAPSKSDYYALFQYMFPNTTGYTSAGVTSPLWVDASGSTPNFVQFQQRFDPPAPTTSRVINSIMLTNMVPANQVYYKSVGYVGADTFTPGAASQSIHTHALLLSPCTQTDTQVLDVYYRVQFILPITFNQGVNAAQAIISCKRASLPGYPGPDLVNVSYSGNIPKNFANGQLNGLLIPYGSSSSMWGLQWVSRPAAYTIYDNPTYYKRKITTTLDITQNIGQIFGTMLYGYNSWGLGTVGYHPVLPEASTKQNCTQVIHNHNINSQVPFIDVNTLASGQGSLAIDSTAWTNPEFPSLYRVDILSSGEPGGTAQYAFSRRDTIGFNGNTYQPRFEVLPWFGYNGNSYSTPGTATNSTVTGSHNILGMVDPVTRANGAGGWGAQPFNLYSIVTYDDTGLTITSIAGAESKTWDATTTPALPVTALKNVEVIGTVIWAGCRNTGLYKIDTVANTVTLMTVGSGTTSHCYGVSYGYGGSIWAVMEGGVAHSMDGSSWTVYNQTTSPQLSFVGVSDANWSTVNCLRVDPATVDNQMLLIRDWGTTVSQTLGSIWWSTTTAASSGPSYQSIRSYRDSIDVSNVGSFWALTDSIWGGGLYSLTFGATIATYLKANQIGIFNSITFDTAISGDPVLLNFMDPTGLTSLAGQNPGYNIASRWLYKDGSHLSEGVVSSPVAGSYSQYIEWFNNAYRPIYMGDGMLTYSIQDVNYNFTGLPLTTAASINYENAPKFQVLTQICSDQTALGGAARHMFWDDYKWNSSTSQWVLGYSAPLVDTSSYLQNGTRSNFAANSYTYSTLRQSWASIPGFAANRVPGPLTIAFTVQSTMPVVAGVPAILVEVSMPLTTAQALVQDPYLANVACLMNLDAGTNGSTVFLDDKFHPVTVTGGVTLSTTSPLLGAGTTSALFVSGSSLSLNSGDWAFPGYSYPAMTMECFVQFTGTATASLIQLGASTYYWNLRTVGGFLSIQNPAWGAWQGTIPINDGLMHHVAFVANPTAGNFKLFVDGVLDFTYGGSMYIYTDTMLILGAGFIGQMAGIRVTPNVARYTTNFTKPTIAWPDFVIQEFGVAWNNGPLNQICSIVNDNFFPVRSTQPTDGLPHRIVVTVNGTTNKIYYDGALVSANTIDTSFNFANTAGDMLITLGGSRGGVTTGLAKVDEFFDGSITDLQFWNVEVPASQVLYDYLHPLAGIMTDPTIGSTGILSTNQVGHYLSTQALNEGKTVHTASQPLLDGCNISFAAGTLGTSFIATDYYTFGMVNGVLKDNATSLTSAYNFYYGPTVRDCVDFGNLGVLSALPAMITTPTPVIWSNQSPDISVTSTIATAIDVWGYAMSQQLIFGDFDISFTNCNPYQAGAGVVYLTVIDPVTRAQLWGFYLQGPNTYALANGVNVGVNYGNYSVNGTVTNTIYNITRTAGVINLRINGVVKYTSGAGASTGGYRIFEYNATPNPYHNVQLGSCTINNMGSNLNGIMIGNSTNLSGFYDPNFYTIDADSISSNVYDMKLNGVAVATLYNTAATAPAVNELAIDCSTGMIICNAADVGKTLTGKVSYLRNP